MALLVGYLSDKYKHRSAFLAVSVFVCMTGISLLAFSGQNSVRYTGMFSFVFLTFPSKGVYRCFLDNWG